MEHELIGSPWTPPKRAVIGVVLGAVVLLAIAALTAAADLSWFDSEQREREAQQAAERELREQQAADLEQQQRQEREAGEASQQQTGDGTEQGLGEASRRLVGDSESGGSLTVEPILDCPGGIIINDQIYFVPNPEECGLGDWVPSDLEPGDRVTESGKTLLVPDSNGPIGGIKIDEDGNVELVPADEVDSDTISIAVAADGSYIINGLAGTGGQPVTIEMNEAGDGLVASTPDGQIASTTDGEVVVDGSQQTIRPGLGSDQSAQGVESDEGNDGSTDYAGSDDDGNADSGSTNQQSGNSGSNSSGSGSGLKLGTPLLIAAAIVVAIAAVVGLVALIVNNLGQRQHQVRDEEPDEEVPAEPGVPTEVPIDYSREVDALELLLMEVRNEPDPRRAIQRVYGAVETGLGNDSVARRPSETPGVYLHRILGHDVSLQPSLASLTWLFELARFSEHPITPDMRDQAMFALQTIRDRYQTLSGQTATDDKEMLV